MNRPVQRCTAERTAATPTEVESYRPLTADEREVVINAMVEAIVVDIRAVSDGMADSPGGRNHSDLVPGRRPRGGRRARRIDVVTRDVR